MRVAGHRRLLRALAASWALGTGLALAAAGSPAYASGPLAGAPSPDPGSPTATPDGADSPDEPDQDDAPLGVTIETMSPPSLPATRSIVVSGTVTNRTDETWRSISLYVVDGGRANDAPAEPLRTPGDLRRAMDVEADTVVGDRVTQVGTFGQVAELAPGATAPYQVSVPAAAISVDGAGVYWFGVHALGSSDSVPGDNVADGRARTFLPYVPTRFDATPVAVSLVVPLTHLVRYDADGRVADEDEWTRDLGRGRLGRLLGLVEAAPGPVTWLVDPAVLDAVARLAAGNRPRSLGPTRERDAPTAPPTSDAPTADGQPAPDTESARVASRWLDRLGDVLDGNEVLTLPYGNVDTAATLARDPDLLEVALAQGSGVLESLGVATTPAYAAPNGYLDPATIRTAGPGTTTLVSDLELGADAPAAADVDDHRVLVTSSGAAAGSPGPSPSLGTVALRQRLLSEAALRAVRSDRQPLFAVLPAGWSVTDVATFWEGFDAPWLDLEPVSEAAATASVDDVALADLDYPEQQQRLELGPATVDGVAGLVDAGDTLQNLLVDNSDIAGRLTEEALTGLAYNVRYDQAGGRATTAAARAWVDQRLGQVQVDASDGVTLAGDFGDFVVTLTNRLDHRVTVGLRAETDAGVEVTAPSRIVLGPGGRGTVQLRARTTTNAVHSVRLVVTDEAGTPTGSTTTVPIRATQVSGAIWLILGSGVVILFVAIGIRLSRRVAAARRGEPGAGRRPTVRRTSPDDAGDAGPPVGAT